MTPFRKIKQTCDIIFEHTLLENFIICVTIIVVVVLDSLEIAPRKVVEFSRIWGCINWVHLQTMKQI